MDQFSSLCHGKCDQMWIWSILDIRKLYCSRKSIWGQKWPISVSYELNLVIWGLFKLGNLLDGPFFWPMPWEMWPEAYLKHFKRQKNMFWASRKSFWGPKRRISENYEVNLTIWGLFRLGNSSDGPFFWSMSWEMWTEVDLKHFG